jgi:hypothetical protein
MIDFHKYDGTYSGLGLHARIWRITPTLTGWRLEFRDPGDKAPTNAGVHRRLAVAQREAFRQI